MRNADTVGRIGIYVGVKQNASSKINVVDA